MINFQEISKKAIKLDSFPQCSLHIFLGHDSCFKNQFKNFMKPYHEEFQITHGQCQSIIFAKTLFLKALSNY